jgi:hypothetical protein
MLYYEIRKLEILCNINVLLLLVYEQNSPVEINCSFEPKDLKRGRVVRGLGVINSISINLFIEIKSINDQ